MKIIDLVLPPRCVLSGEIVAAPGTLSPAAWEKLRFIAPPFCASCGYPFEFQTEISSLCGPCLTERPNFTSARAALVYDDASRDLILKFKHADHLQAAPTLTPMMLRAGADLLDRADVIVPVPLHRWRLLARRYNQAALLAMGLARATGKPAIPDALIRTRATPSQGHKKARDRAANVRKAFALHPKRSVSGKVVVLVDDVFTTGSTVSECTKALLQGGAAEVHVLTVARVVRASGLD